MSFSPSRCATVTISWVGTCWTESGGKWRCRPRQCELDVRAPRIHRQSGVLQDPGLLRCRGRMPAPGNGPKIALKGLYSVYSLTKMFKKEFGRRQDSGILPALWRYFKVLCPALRCSNGSNRRPWNATHRTHQRTDRHVHDSRRHPSICRGAYHGQDRVEDTPP